MLSIIGFILFALSAFAVMLYCLLFLRNITGWLSLRIYHKKNDTKPINITVIIPVRNEETNIENCLRSVTQQTYPSLHTQIIVVNDHSDDRTTEKVKQFTHVLLTNSITPGKKPAIEHAINLANGQLIITTDADCTHHREWLTTLVSFYNDTGAKMIAGPVCFHNEKNVFEKAQSVEFAGMIGLSAAALYYNSPIMCNGANLAYEKKIFEEVNGYDGIGNNPSGDDVMLMQKIHQHYPTEIKFLKSEEAIVKTNAQSSLKHFLMQRSRWASKSFALFNWPTFIHGFVIAATNFLLLFSLLFSIFIPVYLKAVVFLFFIKTLFDFLFVFLSCRFFKKSKYSWLVFFIQPFYSIYLLITSIRGFWGTKIWKDRIFR